MWKIFQEKGDNLSKTNNEFVNQVLWSNGFMNLESVKTKLLTNTFPLVLEDSDIFVKEVDKIIQENLKVVIVGDYDVDGVCSTSVLYKFLKDLNINFDWIIPNRFSDGYGLKVSIVDKAIKLGVDVIITVDNGIKAKDAIDYAKSKGVKVLVTDHHHADLDEIPTNAIAIINPHFKNDNLEFKDVCGAKVIYSLVNYYYKDKELSRTKLLSEMEEIVALATISDVMPLWYGNRFLIQKFIKKVRAGQTLNLGINTIIEKMNIKRVVFNEDNVGFQIGPLLNAPGRLISAELGVYILIEENDKERVGQLVEDAIEINNQRKREVVEALEKTKINETDKVHMVHLEDVSEGIIGIISGRITEDTTQPSFTFVRNGDNLKGSGRSPSNYNLIEGAIRVFKEHPELTLGYGGHAGAMGLTIKDEESLVLFNKYMNWDYLSQNPPAVEKFYIYYDRDSMDLKDLHESVDSLRPFGEGLKPPVFKTEGNIFKVRNFGESKAHSSFTMRSDKRGFYSNYSLFRTKLDTNTKSAEVYFTTQKTYDEKSDRFYYAGNVMDINIK